jgi:hypothetical protein
MPGIYDTLDINYGHAGEKYLAYLVRLPEVETKEQLRKMGEVFQSKVGFIGRERFWYALVACVLYGMWIAHSAGALQLADIKATYQRLWGWCMEQVLRQRNIVSNNKVGEVEALSMFLNAHLADRLVVVENKTGLGEVLVLKHPAAHGKLLVEYNQSTGLLHIDQNAIRNWFNKHQLDPQKIKQDLLTAGVMPLSTGDVKVTLGRGTQYKGGQTRVWRINAKHPALDGIGTILEKDPVEMT